MIIGVKLDIAYFKLLKSGIFKVGSFKTITFLSG